MQKNESNIEECSVSNTDNHLLDTVEYDNIVKEKPSNAKKFLEELEGPQLWIITEKGKFRIA